MIESFDQVLRSTNACNLKCLIDEECEGVQGIFAKRAGKAAGDVSRWLAGKKNMPKSSKTDIERIFGLSSGWLDQRHYRSNDKYERERLPMPTISAKKNKDLVLDAMRDPSRAQEAFIKWSFELPKRLPGNVRIMVCMEKRREMGLID